MIVLLLPMKQQDFFDDLFGYKLTMTTTKTKEVR